MKQKIILLSLFAVAVVGLQAQTYPLVKVHAWSQPALSGTKPGIIVEEGGNQSTAGSTGKMNYYLYAECRTGYKFTITAVWIDGKAYGVKTESINKLPVVMETEQAGKVTLVPATTHKVMQFYPSGQLTISNKASAWLENLVANSAMVIRYKWKGKSWYYAVKKINRLEPVAGS